MDSWPAATVHRVTARGRIAALADPEAEDDIMKLAEKFNDDPFLLCMSPWGLVTGDSPVPKLYAQRVTDENIQAIFEVIPGIWKLKRAAMKNSWEVTVQSIRKRLLQAVRPWQPQSSSL